MATTISNLAVYSWQLELGGPASAGIFDKLPGGLTPPGAQPKYLSAWVTETATAGQLQSVYNLTPKLPLIGSAGGSVTLMLDTNGNGKFDYTDVNANGIYDAGDTIGEEVQIYYNGIDATQSGKQVQGYAHYDLATNTWVDGQGSGTAIVPQPPVVTNPTNPTNPYDPYNPYNPYNPNTYDPYNPYNQYSAPLPDWSLLMGQQWQQPQWQPQWQQQWQPQWQPCCIPQCNIQPDCYTWTPQPCYTPPTYHCPPPQQNHCVPGATNGWKPYKWC